MSSSVSVSTPRPNGLDRKRRSGKVAEESKDEVRCPSLIARLQLKYRLSPIFPSSLSLPPHVRPSYDASHTDIASAFRVSVSTLTAYSPRIELVPYAIAFPPTLGSLTVSTAYTWEHSAESAT